MSHLSQYVNAGPDWDKLRTAVNIALAAHYKDKARARVSANTMYA